MFAVSIMPLRFVHTADIYLDSPLQSLALRDPALAELIGGATCLAFERTVQLSRAHAARKVGVGMEEFIGARRIDLASGGFGMVNSRARSASEGDGYE